jgi:hypothetical protein
MTPDVASNVLGRLVLGRLAPAVAPSVLERFVLGRLAPDVASSQCVGRFAPRVLGRFAPHLKLSEVLCAICSWSS